MKQELDEEFAFLRPAPTTATKLAAAPITAAAEEVPEQRVPPAVGEEMEVASGSYQAMLDAAGWNQLRNGKEIKFEADLDKEISSLSLKPPAATAKTLAAEAPAPAAATAALTIACLKIDVPDQRVPVAVTTTATPTEAAAIAAE